jgi:hypothetical protein
MVEPPTPRHPTRPRVSLVLEARDVQRDMSITREMPLDSLLGTGVASPPLALSTLHGVSQYVRNVLLPKVHIQQSFVEGRPHTLLVEGVDAAKPTQTRPHK